MASGFVAGSGSLVRRLSRVACVQEGDTRLKGLSTAAIMNIPPGSWDVSGAFLNGFASYFFAAASRHQSNQVSCRDSTSNCWAKANAEFSIKPWKILLYGLWCLKPVYGLNDAPVAWQLGRIPLKNNRREEFIPSG